MEPEDLLTYCGVYGGTCARYIEHGALRDLAAALAELVDAHGYHHWMPHEVKEINYVEFRKALDFFARKDTWLVCRGCCKSGGRGPPDCVRECCREHKVDVCFECSKFPCSKVKGNTDMTERAEEYRTLGKEKWLRKQVEKAGQGFELHTKKYYQLWAKEYPPTKKK